MNVVFSGRVGNNLMLLCEVLVRCHPLQYMQFWLLMNKRRSFILQRTQHDVHIKVLGLS